MKKRKLGLMITILMTTFLLLIGLMHYEGLQEQFNLESNDLYSENNMTTRAGFQEIRLNEGLKKSSYRLYNEIKRTSKERVRAYYSNDYKKWSPPLKSGVFFESENTLEAVVGKDVPIKKNGNESYYMLNGKTYKVIGYLGITESSFLDNAVLINDNVYFNQEKSQFILDGEGINKDDPKLFNSQSYAQNNGIKRKLNIDFFTPLILIFGKIIILSTMALLGRFFFLVVENECKLKFLLGFSYLKIRKENFCLLSLAYFGSALFVFFVVFSVFKIQWSFNIIIELGVLYLCFVITNCIFFKKIQKGEKMNE